jgi:hypothetical protein
MLNLLRQMTLALLIFNSCNALASYNHDDFKWDDWADYDSGEEMADADPLVPVAGPGVLSAMESLTLAAMMEDEDEESRKRGREEDDDLVPPALFKVPARPGVLDLVTVHNPVFREPFPIIRSGDANPAWGKVIKAKPISQYVVGNFGFEFRNLNGDAMRQVLYRFDPEMLRAMKATCTYMYSFRGFFKPKARIPQDVLYRAIDAIRPIRSLIFEGFTGLSADMVSYALEVHQDTLVSIVIADCNYNAYAGLSMIDCTKLWRVVVPLPASRRPGAGPLKDWGEQDMAIGGILDMNPDLATLNVSGWTGLTNVAFENEDEGPLMRMTHIILNGCKMIDDTCIRVISERCPNLEMLALGWCPKVTDRSLPYLQAMCDRKLKFLSLHDTGVRSEESLAVLMSYFTMNLATEWPVEWLK